MLFDKGTDMAYIYVRSQRKCLKKKEPGHPLLSVFQPYLQKDQLIFEKEAADYYNQIQMCSISEDMKKNLSAVFRLSSIGSNCPAL